MMCLGRMSSEHRGASERGQGREWRRRGDEGERRGRGCGRGLGLPERGFKIQVGGKIYECEHG